MVECTFSPNWFWITCRFWSTCIIYLSSNSPFNFFLEGLNNYWNLLFIRTMLVVIAVAVFVVIIVIAVLDDNFITSVSVSGEVNHDRHDFVLRIIIVRYNLYRGDLLDNLHLLNRCLDNLLHYVFLHIILVSKLFLEPFPSVAGLNIVLGEITASLQWNLYHNLVQLSVQFVNKFILYQV